MDRRGQTWYTRGSHSSLAKVAVSQELGGLVRTESTWRTLVLLVPRVTSSVARASPLIDTNFRLLLPR